jgi:hypothetical protein
MRPLLLFALTAALAACNRQSDNARAGGVSAGEAKALDDAAEMIDSRQLPPEAVQPPAARTGAPASPAAAK